MLDHFHFRPGESAIQTEISVHTNTDQSFHLYYRKEEKPPSVH